MFDSLALFDPFLFEAFLLDAPPLSALVAETRLQSISTQIQKDWANRSLDSQLWLLVIPVAAATIGWLMARLANRPKPPFNRPLHLFLQLQRAHRLNKPARKLLARIAEEAELAQPAVMLLGPSAFDRAVERAGRRIRLGRRQQNRLAQLRRQLFAG